MFGLFKSKPKVGTVFLAGTSVSGDGTEIQVMEYSTYGEGELYVTAKDFIKAVHDAHKHVGYKLKLDIVKF